MVQCAYACSDAGPCVATDDDDMYMQNHEWSLSQLKCSNYWIPAANHTGNYLSNTYT